MLRVEWERLRRDAGEPSDERLIEAAVARGSRLLRDDPATAAPPSTPRRVAKLRSQVVLRAATASAYRHRLVVDRQRLAAAKDDELRSYQDGLTLDRDLVPPLKLRAKALRAEIRRLETETRARGLDPDAIEPTVDWPETLAVDSYDRPRFVSDADRKQAAVEFFRRLG
jgi:hypothetical protein